MNWTTQIDAYCERLTPDLWAEPANALTNLAFIVVALWTGRRAGDVQGARVLSAILLLIGIGSLLFHTFATAWASLADVLPIGMFILTYLYLVNRDVVGWPRWAAILGTATFIPYAAALVPLLNTLPFFHISNFYWTVPILLVLYGWVLRHSHPATAKGMALGALILSLSITLRSLDAQLCDTWPIGTHFAWHLLNAAMLGWMIEVYRRHMLEGGAPSG